MSWHSLLFLSKSARQHCQGWAGVEYRQGWNIGETEAVTYLQLLFATCPDTCRPGALCSYFLLCGEVMGPIWLALAGTPVPVRAGTCWSWLNNFHVTGEAPSKTLVETAKEATEKAKETALAATEKAKDLASKATTKKKQYV